MSRKLAAEGTGAIAFSPLVDMIYNAGRLKAFRMM